MTAKLTASLSALVALSATAAFAQPEQVATYRDWIVYKAEVNGDTICYAATTAEDMDPPTLDHGDVFFLVASWSSGAANQQPSFMTGYSLRERPEPVIRIGSDKWDMYISGRESFVESDTDEGRLVNAMRRGTDMRVSAMSERGNATEYTFSLLGVSNALDRASDECGS